MGTKLFMRFVLGVIIGLIFAGTGWMSAVAVAIAVGLATALVASFNPRNSRLVPLKIGTAWAIGDFIGAGIMILIR